MQKKVDSTILMTTGSLGTAFLLASLLLALPWLSPGALGLPPALIIGLVVLLLFLVTILSMIHLDARRRGAITRLQDEIAAERIAGRRLQGEFEDTIERRTFELQAINGALHREIAERIQMTEEVRELQKQQRLILDCAGEGILGLDNLGRTVFMNRAAAEMLGWGTDELLGRTHHELIHHTRPDGSPHPENECPIHMAYRDGVVHYKTGDIFWHKNGSSFPVEYVSTPICDNGMLTGAVVVFRDMTTFA